ncbi:DUF4193 domain-containing protein [Streptomyces sp. CBMA123]|uniref:DUF4193 domain-containing protein n=1 Tax=Streptomyces sp. CBMA123 TaxID=1896313 RepID=UPI001661C49C|nr:DUF4193 domain-containing protein [Streptomyces sp. CBMA123]MBD0694955.1 dUTPase [Streptomyces sp. CBMA123]
MATDYDAPRRTEDDNEESLEELKSRREERRPGAASLDGAEEVESVELPGADLSGEELTVKVLPEQPDEFVCATCSMVHHRSQIAHADGQGRLVCRDCAP